jgi:hypothetical protein
MSRKVDLVYIRETPTSGVQACIDGSEAVTGIGGQHAASIRSSPARCIIHMYSSHQLPARLSYEQKTNNIHTQLPSLTIEPVSLTAALGLHLASTTSDGLTSQAFGQWGDVQDYAKNCIDCNL